MIISNIELKKDLLKTKLLCTDNWLANGKRMHSERQPIGSHELLWEGKNLPDLEARGEMENGLGRIMMSYSCVLSKELFLNYL